MKRLTLILSIFIVFIFIFFSIRARIEGLCGNYSLTYDKVKDLFKESDISGVSEAYNMHYNRDLYC